MKYMLLVHHDEQVIKDLGESELQKLRGESVQLANEISSQGAFWCAVLALIGKGVKVRGGGGQPQSLRRYPPSHKPWWSIVFSQLTRLSRSKSASIFPVPSATEERGFSARDTGTPVSCISRLSIPLSNAPPPVNTMPRSAMSADSSGGVRS